MKRSGGAQSFWALFPFPFWVSLLGSASPLMTLQTPASWLKLSCPWSCLTFTTSQHAKAMASHYGDVPFVEVDGDEQGTAKPVLRRVGESERSGSLHYDFLWTTARIVG